MDFGGFWEAKMAPKSTKNPTKKQCKITCKKVIKKKHASNFSAWVWWPLRIQLPPGPQGPKDHQAPQNTPHSCHKGTVADIYIYIYIYILKLGVRCVN